MDSVPTVSLHCQRRIPAPSAPPRGTRTPHRASSSRERDTGRRRAGCYQTALVRPSPVPAAGIVVGAHREDKPERTSHGVRRHHHRHAPGSAPAVSSPARSKEEDTSPAYRSLDAASGGKLKTILRKAGFRAGVGRHLRVHALDGVTADGVLIVGCGPKDGMAPARYHRIARAAARAAVASGAGNAAWSLGEIDVEGRDPEWKSRIAVECLSEAAYHFDAMRSKADDERISPPGRISIAVARAHRDEAAAGVETGRAIAAGVSLARELGNLPGNVCTPTYLANEAKSPGRKASERQVQGARRSPDEALAHGIAALGRARKPRAAPAHRPRIPGRSALAGSDRTRRQGHHVRLGGDIDQACGDDGRDEVRHVRRGERDRRDGGGARPSGSR